MTEHKSQSLDERLASGDKAQWQIVRDAITSGQVPPDRVAEILRDYPAFAAWATGTSGRPPMPDKKMIHPYFRSKWDLPTAQFVSAIEAAEASLSSENERLRAALTEIRDRHVPDQSMADGSDEVTYLRRQYAELRRIAREAIGESHA